MAIKTREEIEQRKQDFIDGVPAKDMIDKESIWSLAHLKRLTNEQIVERMERLTIRHFCIPVDYSMSYAKDLPVICFLDSILMDCETILNTQ